MAAGGRSWRAAPSRSAWRRPACTHRPDRPWSWSFVILAPAVAIGGLLGGFDPTRPRGARRQFQSGRSDLDGDDHGRGRVLEPDRRSARRGDLHGRLFGRPVDADRSTAQRRWRLSDGMRRSAPSRRTIARRPASRAPADTRRHLADSRDRSLGRLAGRRQHRRQLFELGCHRFESRSCPNVMFHVRRHPE